MRVQAASPIHRLITIISRYYLIVTHSQLVDWSIGRGPHCFSSFIIHHSFHHSSFHQTQTQPQALTYASCMYIVYLIWNLEMWELVALSNEWTLSHYNNKVAHQPRRWACTRFVMIMVWQRTRVGEEFKRGPRKPAGRWSKIEHYIVNVYYQLSVCFGIHSFCLELGDLCVEFVIWTRE